MNNYSQTRLAHRPLSPVPCTSSIEHCALNIVRCVLCRVALYIARRPPVLVPRALVRAHRALHRGQSSSGRVRKNGTAMGTVLRVVVLFSFVLCFLAALRRLFGGLFFVLRLKRCGLSLEFSDFRT
mgnify:CR=1 FL=1